MFGPCWLNFYGSPREFSELPDEYDDLNLGKASIRLTRTYLLFSPENILTVLGVSPLHNPSFPSKLGRRNLSSGSARQNWFICIFMSVCWRI